MLSQATVVLPCPGRAQVARKVSGTKAVLIHPSVFAQILTTRPPNFHKGVERHKQSGTPKDRISPHTCLAGHFAGIHSNWLLEFREITDASKNFSWQSLRLCHGIF